VNTLLALPCNLKSTRNNEIQHLKFLVQFTDQTPLCSIQQHETGAVMFSIKDNVRYIK